MAEMEFVDRPETKTFGIEINYEDKKKRVALSIGNCAIALFRHRPEMDYLAVYLEDEGDEDKNRWIFCFGREEMVYWMGGVALTDYGQRAITLANRESGSFESNFGWAPDVVVEDWPNDNEIESYITHSIGQSFEDLHEDLNEALSDEFEEELDS